MIRFSCPHCGREYTLADALAHLPLLCKGCGQRLTVPEPQAEPEPPPPPPVKPRPTPKPPPVVAAPPPPEAKPTLANGPADRYHSPADPDLDSDEAPDADIFHREPPPRPAATPKVPPPKEPAPQPRPRRGLSLVVDVAVFLILLAVGVFAAEMLLGKKSAVVLRESSTAPKFPPTDLLIWLAGPVLAALIYVWLGTRGWTVGGWLKRRAGG